MNVFLLLGAYFLFNCTGGLSNKKNSASLRGGTSDRPVFIVITAVIACLFFAAMNGFSVRLNPVTVTYAAAFSVIVFAALILTLLVYRYASIPTVSVVKSTLTLIVTSVLGSALFSEKITALTGIRTAMLVVSSLLLYVSSVMTERAEKKTDAPVKPAKNNRIAFTVVMALLVLDNCAVTLITKSFALRTDVTDENSYYFATNVILFFIGMVWMFIATKGNIKTVFKGLGELKPINYFFILLSTVSSNAVSLLSVWLVALLEVASFSAYTSASEMVASFTVSLFFKERQDVFSVAAIVIAVVSFLIGTL